MPYFATLKDTNFDIELPESVNVDSFAPKEKRKQLAADYLSSINATAGKYDILRYNDSGEFHSHLFAITVV